MSERKKHELNAANDRGYSCGKDGGLITENPFSKETDEWDAWREGFMQAEDEIAGSEPDDDDD